MLLMMAIQSQECASPAGSDTRVTCVPSAVIQYYTLQDSTIENR